MVLQENAATDARTQEAARALFAQAIMSLRIGRKMKTRMVLGRYKTSKYSRKYGASNGEVNNR